MSDFIEPLEGDEHAEPDLPDEAVVYEAKPGRYVVQELIWEGFKRVWSDHVAYESLNLAQEKAKDLASLNVQTYRVVDRGGDD